MWFLAVLSAAYLLQGVYSLTCQSAVLTFILTLADLYA